MAQENSAGVIDPVDLSCTPLYDRPISKASEEKTDDGDIIWNPDEGRDSCKYLQIKPKKPKKLSGGHGLIIQSYDCLEGSPVSIMKLVKESASEYFSNRIYKEDGFYGDEELVRCSKVLQGDTYLYVVIPDVLDSDKIKEVSYRAPSQEDALMFLEGGGYYRVLADHKDIKICGLFETLLVPESEIKVIRNLKQIGYTEQPKVDSTEYITQATHHNSTSSSPARGGGVIGNSSNNNNQTPQVGQGAANQSPSSGKDKTEYKLLWYDTNGKTVSNDAMKITVRNERYDRPKTFNDKAVEDMIQIEIKDKRELLSVVEVKNIIKTAWPYLEQVELSELCLFRYNGFDSIELDESVNKGEKISLRHPILQGELSKKELGETDWMNMNKTMSDDLPPLPTVKCKGNIPPKRYLCPTFDLHLSPFYKRAPDHSSQSQLVVEVETLEFGVCREEMGDFDNCRGFFVDDFRLALGKLKDKTPKVSNRKPYVADGTESKTQANGRGFEVDGDTRGFATAKFTLKNDQSINEQKPTKAVHWYLREDEIKDWHFQRCSWIAPAPNKHHGYNIESPTSSIHDNMTIPYVSTEYSHYMNGEDCTLSVKYTFSQAEEDPFFGKFSNDDRVDTTTVNVTVKMGLCQVEILEIQNGWWGAKYVTKKYQEVIIDEEVPLVNYKDPPPPPQPKKRYLFGKHSTS